MTGALVPTGAVTIRYYAGTTATGTRAGRRRRSAAGTYTAVATYAGDSNYLPIASSAAITFTISDHDRRDAA